MPDPDHDTSPQMEGATMTSPGTDPFTLLSQLSANEVTAFSLPHRCAQMQKSDLVARTKILTLTIACVPHRCIRPNRLDLFLDFTEKLPHSSSQATKYAD